MVKTTLNFDIVPIFDQATAGVWNDFIKIEAACDKAIYGLSGPSKSTIKTRLREYKSNLYEYKHNFAFIACYRNCIIGFAYGFSISSYEVYLNRLYVSPKYHRCGIGSQLLHATEQSAALFAQKISLVPLATATDFYAQKHKYTQFDYMEKNISPIANSIVPVFQYIKKEFNLEFAIPVDTAALKQSKQQPILVHISNDNKIDAVATRLSNGKQKLWSSTNKLNTNSIKLLNALNKVR